VTDLVDLQASSFSSSGVHVRRTAASIRGGARANADLPRSSRASGAAREARSGFVPSAVARLRADYVVFACGHGRRTRTVDACEGDF
jgi:hypothetical protein